MDPPSTSFRVKVDLTELDANRNAVSWYFVNAIQCESIEQLKEAVFKWFKIDLKPESVELWLDECIVPDDAPVLMLSANDLLVMRNRNSKHTTAEDNKNDVGKTPSTDEGAKPVEKSDESQEAKPVEKSDASQEVKPVVKSDESQEAKPVEKSDESREAIRNEDEKQIEIEGGNEKTEENLLSITSENESLISSENIETEKWTIISEDSGEKEEIPNENNEAEGVKVEKNEEKHVPNEVQKSGKVEVQVETPKKVVEQSSTGKQSANQAQNQTATTKKKKRKKVNRTTGSNFRRDQRRLQAHLQKLNIPYVIKPDPSSLKKPEAATATKYTSVAGRAGGKEVTSKFQPNKNNSANKRKQNNNNTGQKFQTASKKQQNRNGSAKRRKMDRRSGGDQGDYYTDDSYYDKYGGDQYGYDDQYSYDDKYGYDSYTSYDRGETSFEGDGFNSRYRTNNDAQFGDSHIGPFLSSNDPLSHGHSSTFDPSFSGGIQSPYQTMDINVNLLDPSIRSPGPYNRQNFSNWQNTSGPSGGLFSPPDRRSVPDLMSVPITVAKNTIRNRLQKIEKKRKQKEKRKNDQGKRKMKQDARKRKKETLAVTNPPPKPLKGILKKSNFQAGMSTNETTANRATSSPSTFDNDPYGETVDYSQYPIMRRFPKMNDIIAYKMLESTGGAVTDISDYKVGKVIHYDDESKEIQLEFPEPVVLYGNSEKGGAAEEEFTEEIAVDFGSIVEVRLITDHKWR